MNLLLSLVAKIGGFLPMTAQVAGGAAQIGFDPL